MLITRIVIRLLSKTDELLGWTEVHAEARGDGQLWAVADVLIGVEQTGVASVISAHWVDVNVEARRNIGDYPVQLGQVVTVLQPGPIFVVGPQAGGLPAVTVRGNVSISPMTGGVGLRSLSLGG